MYINEKAKTGVESSGGNIISAAAAAKIGVKMKNAAK
jgi:hypothetical protein